MSGNSTAQDEHQQRVIDQWWNSLVSGVIGKVALLSIVPLCVYIASSVSSNIERQNARHEEMVASIRQISDSLREMRYRQDELVRHVDLIERKVLGYSSLNGRSTIEPVTFPPSPGSYQLMLPTPREPYQPFKPPTKPPDRPNRDGDQPAAITPQSSERRRVVADDSPR